MLKEMTTMHFGDIVIHIDENLDDDHIHALERDLGEEQGVYSACMHERRRHLLVVDFDPEQLRPSSIVYAVRNRGLHAEMIGF
jgi:hypothetical protein